MEQIRLTSWYMVVYHPIIYKVLLYIQPVVGLGISEASTVSRKTYSVRPMGRFVGWIRSVNWSVAVRTEKKVLQNHRRRDSARWFGNDGNALTEPVRKTLAMTQNSWLFKGFCWGDEILPKYIGIIISHNKY